MQTTTINTKIFELKVETLKLLGYTTYRIFEDSDEFKEYAESGFMNWLLCTYEHEIKGCGSIFIIDLTKKK